MPNEVWVVETAQVAEDVVQTMPRRVCASVDEAKAAVDLGMRGVRWERANGGDLLTCWKDVRLIGRVVKVPYHG